MFSNLCNICLCRKLTKAWAKQFELTWLGSLTILKSEPGSAWAQKQVGYQSWAWLGFRRKQDFRARLGLASDINQVLRWAWACLIFLSRVSLSAFPNLIVYFYLFSRPVGCFFALSSSRIVLYALLGFSVSLYAFSSTRLSLFAFYRPNVCFSALPVPGVG